MKVKLINPEIYHNYAENLLKARGVKNVEAFLNPTLDLLQSYNHLNNIEEGVHLIDWALSVEKLNILLVVD